MLDLPNRGPEQVVDIRQPAADGSVVEIGAGRKRLRGCQDHGAEPAERRPPCPRTGIAYRLHLYEGLVDAVEAINPSGLPRVRKVRRALLRRLPSCLGCQMQASAACPDCPFRNWPFGVPRPRIAPH
jgi:hypothetical protein